jgi:hypothetical protein
MKLNSLHIEYVLEGLHNNTTKVKNIRLYLTAVLYNAPLTIKVHYDDRKGVIMTKLTRYEQETVINFNAGEKMATVYTADPAVIRNLDTLVIDHSDTFKCIKKRDISKTYEMHKSSVTYRKPRRLSEEQRKKAQNRMKSVNNGKRLRGEKLIKNL